MNEEKMLKGDMTTKQLAFGMMSYSAGSILGPLIFFGFIGYLLDKYFDTKPVFIIIGVLVAFVITNVLILKKVNKLSKKFNDVEPKEVDNKNKEEIK